jgi:hypothetical protein
MINAAGGATIVFTDATGALVTSVTTGILDAAANTITLSWGYEFNKLGILLAPLFRSFFRRLIIKLSLSRPYCIVRPDQL